MKVKALLRARYAEKMLEQAKAGPLAARRLPSYLGDSESESEPPSPDPEQYRNAEQYWEAVMEKALRKARYAEGMLQQAKAESLAAKQREACDSDF